MLVHEQEISLRSYTHLENSEEKVTEDERPKGADASKFNGPSFPWILDKNPIEGDNLWIFLSKGNRTHFPEFFNFTN